MKPLRAVCFIVFGLVFGLPLAPAVTAHASFTVGTGTNLVTFRFGWANEPPIVDQANAVSIKVLDNRGRGITGLTEASPPLTATILYGGKEKVLELEESRSAPGNYSGGIIPTVAGQYGLRITGKVGTNNVDHTTSGTEVLEKVGDADEQTFPDNHETIVDLQSKLDQAQMMGFGTLGAVLLVLILSVLGLVFALRALSTAKAGLAAAQEAQQRPPPTQRPPARAAPGAGSPSSTSVRPPTRK